MNIHGQPLPWNALKLSREEARRALADDGIIAAIVERFDSLIGLWADDPEGQ
jgi:hypothetical protein